MINFNTFTFHLCLKLNINIKKEIVFQEHLNGFLIILTCKKSYYAFFETFGFLKIENKNIHSDKIKRNNLIIFSRPPSFKTTINRSVYATDKK